jgi:hypothetical protein
VSQTGECAGIERQSADVKENILLFGDEGKMAIDKMADLCF